jgi:hypothetical protein
VTPSPSRSTIAETRAAGPRSAAVIGRTSTGCRPSIHAEGVRASDGDVADVERSQMAAVVEVMVYPALENRRLGVV